MIGPSERKALFFDIDGTLLTYEKKELPESAKNAIEAARRAGHLVFINSGRARCLMQEIEGRAAVDGYLCGCGTYIEIHGKTVFHHLISAKRRMELQRAVGACRLDGILEGTNGCVIQAGPGRMPEVERVVNLMDREGCFREADWNQELTSFDKFCVLADQNSDTERFLELLKPDIAVIDRGGRLYECVPAGFDKATAMKAVLEYFGIPWENSYAFGDSANDLAMIRYACHSVIMGRHASVLEPYASFITKNVEEDGVAYAMECLNIV